jgi:hypothetical protein
MKTVFNYLFIILIVSAACKREEQKCEVIKEEKGLSCEKISLLMNGEILCSPVIPIDSIIEMSFGGLCGFRANGNTVYPGGTLKVFDDNGEVIFKLEDVFIDYDETGASKDLVKKNISMFLEIGSPMKSGHTYTWENIIWDKRANRKIVGTTKITVE